MGTSGIESCEGCQLTPDQGFSVEIKSLFSSKGDKRIIMFPLGL